MSSTKMNLQLLLVACEKGDLVVVESLSTKNPRLISKANNQGWTPLLLASFNGRLEVVQFLLSNGAKKEFDLPSGETPLFLASSKNHCDVVKFLICEGLDKETANEDGTTPLFIATQNGHVDVVELLLSAGVEDKAVLGATSLYIACQYGHLEIVKLLVTPGVVDKSTKGTPLYIACLCGRLDVVRLLVSYGGDVDEANVDSPECKGAVGSTPFFAACYGGHFEIVRFLLSVHVDKDKRRVDDAGATPFLVACEEGHTDIVRLLLSHGVDKEKPSKRGETPLEIACYMGHLEIVKLLLAGAANIDDALGRSPLFVECRLGPLFAACRGGNGNLKTVKFLIKKGFDLNEARKYDGATPLHFACQEGATDVAKLLICSGADTNKISYFGRKALDMCSTGEMRAVLEDSIALMSGGGVITRRKGRSCACCDGKEGEGAGTIGGPPKFHICSSCRFVAYCSKSCQSRDWTARHKKECKVFQSISSVR